MATYIDEDRIGSGGFGEVYRCRRKEDDAKFALKRLAANSDASAIARFVKEVRILSSLDHPNIVKVVGKRLQPPRYFYVMPLYNHSLRAEISGLVVDMDRI